MVDRSHTRVKSPVESTEEGSLLFLCLLITSCNRGNVCRYRFLAEHRSTRPERLQDIVLVRIRWCCYQYCVHLTVAEDNLQYNIIELEQSVVINEQK